MASFYVGKTKTGWRIIEETWVNGKRSQQTVPKEAYLSLGINPNLTIDEIKAQVKQLNKSNTIVKHKASKAARNQKLISVIQSVYVDEELAKAFTARMKETHFGSELHLSKLLAHWQTIQGVVVELELLPHQYADEARRFYRLFKERNYSLDYTNKLLRILNAFGGYVNKSQNRHYEPVEAPRGDIREAINDSYTESESYVGASLPLTPQMLASQGAKLSASQFNWLLISVWFGLRPSEVDSLKDEKLYKLEAQDGVDVLWVYQKKLVGVKKEKRWKPIPILFSEQKQCMDIIAKGDWKRPLTRKLKEVFDCHITTYGGRKGFVALMQSRNQQLEHISQWLGHQSIDRTWKSYKDKSIVLFTKTRTG